MKPLLVCEWMHTDVITINPELRVERVWELMERQHIRHLPVVKDDKLVGIITARDLKRTIFPTTPLSPPETDAKPQPHGLPGDLPVEAIMTRGVYTAHPNDPLLGPAAYMLKQKIGALPVVDDDGKLIGMLTETDLLKALVFLLQRSVGS
jgi:CBS domain-containing protein